MLVMFLNGLLCSLSFLQAGAGATPEELAKAESRLAEASRRRSEAQEALTQTYEALEGFFESVRADSGVALVGKLARAGEEALREWLAKPPADPDPVTARNQLQSFCRKRIAAELAAGGDVPPPLIGPIISRFAASLAAEGVAASADLEEKARGALHTVLNPKQSFPENWNRILHREITASRFYEKTEDEFAAALKRVERLRRPDRFHPAYRKVPEGMILVLGGNYSLGENVGWDLDSNRTQKKLTVQLRPFYIDRYEVTNRQYLAFLGSFPPGEAARRVPSTWTRGPEGAFQIPSGREDHPVTGVSWEDAAAYASWTGRRLPTEDEWEAAARGPQSQVYPWGNGFEPWRPNHNGTGIKDTAAAGSFRGDRSVYGCFDMAGNVMEWTASLPDGKTISKLRENGNVILRGGSFRKGPASASAIYRWAYPGQTTREADIGFRCAQDV